MGAFTISAACDGCGAEINRPSQRFGCRRCWEVSKAENRTFCERCARLHPEHKPPAPVFEPPTVILIGNMFDLLAQTCSGGHHE